MAMDNQSYMSQNIILGHIALIVHIQFIEVYIIMKYTRGGIVFGKGNVTDIS